MHYRGIRFRLVGDGLRGAFDGFRVAQVEMFDRRQIVVQFVHERNTGRNIQLDDFVFRDFVQILDEGAQAVSMRCDQDASSGPDCRRNGFVPVRQDSINGILQTLRQGNLFRLQIRISRIPGR